VGALLGMQAGSAHSQAPACRSQKTDAVPAALGIENIGAALADLLPCGVVLHCWFCKALL